MVRKTPLELPIRRRPASIGPVKHLLRRVDLTEVKAVMDGAIANGDQSVRRAVVAALGEGLPSSVTIETEAFGEVILRIQDIVGAISIM